MKLQALRYFVQIKEKGSFSEAAKQCFVTQPALSRAIKELEEELECALFERKGRNLVLTKAGYACYEEAKLIIKQCDRLKERVHEVNLYKPNIRLGYIIINHLEYFRNRMMKEKKYHFKNIDTIYDSAAHLEEALVNKELDMALLPYTDYKDRTNLVVKPLVLNKLHIIVHQSHPLYNHKTVTFEQLRYEKLIGWDEEDLPLISRYYNEAFKEKGIDPLFVARGKKMGDMLSLMSIHHAVSICTPVTSQLSEEYHCIEIEDSKMEYGLCLCWYKESQNDSMEELIRYL